VYKLLLSLRFFRRRKINLLSVVCIALGVMVLIIVYSVLEGFQTRLKSAFRRTIPHVVVERLSHSRTFEDYAEVLAKVPGVTGVAPRVETLGLIGWADEKGPNTLGGNEAGRKGISIFAIDPSLENRVTRFSEMLRELSPLRDVVVTREGKKLRGKILSRTDQGLEIDTEVHGIVNLDRSRVYVTWQEKSLEVKNVDDPFHVPDAMRRNRRPLPGIIVGEELARYLDLNRGDEVTLLSIRLKRVGKPGEQDQFVPSNRSFYITGAFRSEMYEQNLFTVYIPIEEGRDMQKRASYAMSKVAVGTNDFDRAEAVKLACDRALLDAGFFGHKLTTWQDRNRPLLSALVVEKRVLTVLMFFLVLMACGTILAILYMMVLEKRREIGILKALGAPMTGLLNLFLLNGGIIGFLGSLFGVGVGLVFLRYINDIEGFLTRTVSLKVFPKEVYVFDSLPVEYDAMAICIVAVSTVIFSILAAFIPAYIAARSDPVRSLRNE